jgi:hypothetical protein
LGASNEFAGYEAISPQSWKQLSTLHIPTIHGRKKKVAYQIGVNMIKNWINWGLNGLSNF